MQQETNQKRLAALPVKYTSYREKEDGEKERTTGKKTEISRDAEGASPHEKTQKNKHDVENREAESEQSIQMCKVSNEQTETRCHTYTHTQNTSDRLPTLDLTVHEQQWRSDEWSKNGYIYIEREV